MILYKRWLETKRDGYSATLFEWSGWYLLGFIPLYIRKREV